MRDIQITTPVPAPGEVFRIFVDSTEYVPKEEKPPPAPYPALRWEDVKRGAELLGKHSGANYLVVHVTEMYGALVGRPSGNGAGAVTAGAVGDYLLKKAAPPLIEQLTLGCCVRLADGSKRWISELDLEDRSGNWAYCLPDAQEGNELMRFTEDKLVDAELVDDFPEVQS